jgi:hypothetical protein
LLVPGATLKRLPERDQDLKGKCPEKVEAYSATPPIDLEVAGTDGKSILTHKVEVLFTKMPNGAGCEEWECISRPLDKLGGPF